MKDFLYMTWYRIKHWCVEPTESTKGNDLLIAFTLLLYVAHIALT